MIKGLEYTSILIKYMSIYSHEKSPYTHNICTVLLLSVSGMQESVLLTFA